MKYSSKKRNEWLRKLADSGLTANEFKEANPDSPCAATLRSWKLVGAATVTDTARTLSKPGIAIRTRTGSIIELPLNTDPQVLTVLLGAL